MNSCAIQLKSPKREDAKQPLVFCQWENGGDTSPTATPSSCGFGFYKRLSLTARPLSLKLLSHRTLLRGECIAGQGQALGLACLNEKSGRRWANENLYKKRRHGLTLMRFRLIFEKVLKLRKPRVALTPSSQYLFHRYALEPNLSQSLAVALCVILVQ